MRIILFITVFRKYKAANVHATGLREIHFHFSQIVSESQFARHMMGGVLNKRAQISY